MSEVHDFFDKLEHQLKNNLPFAAYSKPNSDEVKAMLQEDDKMHKVSNYNESGFVFAPFNDREDAILIPLDNSEVISLSFVIPENDGIQTNLWITVFMTMTEKTIHKE